MSEAANTLTQLFDAFVEARVERIATAPLDIPPGLCRYGCGRRWQITVTTRFGGHSLCAVTPRFLAELGSLMRANPELTFKLVAFRLGVNYRVVHTWYRQACQAQPIRASR